MKALTELWDEKFSSMRTRGWLFVGFLLAYIFISAIFIFSEKSSLVSRFETYNNQIGIESTLIEAELVVARLYGELFFSATGVGRDEILDKLHTDFNYLNKLNHEIKHLYPEQAKTFESLITKLAQTAQNPTVDNIEVLRKLMGEFSMLIQPLNRDTQLIRKSTIGDLIADSNELALLALYLGLFGIVLTGFITSVFFTRLSQDLVRLRDWLLMLSTEKDVPLLINRRKDELGTVYEKTHELAHALALRETQVVVERQKRIFQKKDAAVRNMLAGLVHELGNPIASLSAVLRNRDSAAEPAMTRDIIDTSLERVESIIGDLNQWEMSEQTGQSLVCLNERVRQYAKLMKYDERWQESSTALNLGDNLPALQLSIKDIQEVISILTEIMLENSKNCRHSEIEISTEYADDVVTLSFVELKNAPFEACYKNGTRCPQFGLAVEDIEINLLAAEAIAQRMSAEIKFSSDEMMTSIRLIIPTK